MARANEVIGEAECQCCGRLAPVKQAANGLAYMTCQWCNSKLQAFSAAGDARIRARIKQPASPAAPAPAPVPPPQPRQPNPAGPTDKPGGLWAAFASA